MFTSRNMPDSFFNPVKQNDHFIAALDAYCKKHYNDVDLPPQFVNQLAFLQTNSTQTSESNVRLSNKEAEKESLDIEIKRSLSRLNCCYLLFQGGPAAHQKFVASQKEAGKLSYETFEKISALLSKQSERAKEVLKASCFIVMSDKAKDLANRVNVTSSCDSEKFLTETITHCPQIYPAVSSLQDESTKSLLPWMYLRNTHARHMLYTEGGNHMFDVLKDKIRNSAITQEEYSVWYGRWIINNAGFRGHEEPLGSAYLTENVGQAILTLNAELNILQNNPEYDVLTGYLEKRSEQLAVGNNRYLAHLAVLMQLSTYDEVQELKRWFDNLTQDKQKEHQEFYETMCTTLEPTPTFTPAMIDNLRSVGCNISDSITIFTKIFFKAFPEYHGAIEKNKIKHENTPLCFRDIAFKKKLQVIVDSYHKTGDIPTIAVDEQGNVVVAAEKPDIKMLRCP